ncbi:NAD(P)/FAD-dependent oxidoreductase [Bradyrhizobium sp. sBnM-33]|jgi:protoporphyrinogen oxidase|uniref:protoporphyrinogen/coproporphyrinogen oxidase n=1 Tax=Bradyrhizobium sp. sBnM-33 TaxID=2831780 RepID=UPI0024BE7FE8|nr:NAD(P)-binding protein [Bradyrhizobium sp. sBnM-33]
MKDSGFVILGSGVAGLGAANALNEEGIRPRLYDSRAKPGGLTSSFDSGDGFVFDEGVHISFTDNPRVKELFAKSVDGQYEVGHVYCNNYWRGHWIKHPAQVNLHGLPVALVVNCIKDFVEASNNPKPVIQNYEDWLLAAFGRTFTENFPAIYTVKYHTTEARNMTTDWLGPRLYRPKLEEVLQGALQHEPSDVFYVNEFRYPSHGGFASFLNHFIPMAEILCNHEVTQIDPKQRELTFRNGSKAPYENLISSIPLPKVVPLIKGAPKDVLDAAALLACSQVAVVNIGLNRRVEVKPQWSYFYDEDIPFARVSHRGNLSPNNVPPGCSGFQCEIYFSDKYRPLTGKPEDWIEPAIDGLIKCGLVKDRSEIIHKSCMWLPFGNIIFDHDRPKALAIVHGYLDDVDVRYCGRFGDWGYIWTDHAFLSGERAAKGALRGVKTEAVT